MKKLIGILIFQFLIGTYFSNAAGRRFFIVTGGNNKEASAYLAYFESKVFNQLKSQYPCVEINSLSSVVALLDLERQKQLLGTGSDNAVSNIAEAMGSDYLISLKVRVIEGMAIIDAFCAEAKKAKVISRASTSAPHGENGIDAVEKVSTQLIDGLKNIEICPFQGPVSIRISSEIDSTNTVDYSVYCNESDQQFHQKIEIHNTTISDWKLQRMAVSRTEGIMTFNSNEESKITEENGCYKCKSGREGGRSSAETRSMEVKGSGISHKSIYNSKPQDDTRIELKFLENGTYLLIAKGTSEPAIGIEKMVTKAEGTCDNQPQQTKTETREITIPLNVIFGPYAGKSTDKLLQEKDEKKIKNPTNHEEEIISIDFSLKQKEN